MIRRGRDFGFVGKLLDLLLALDLEGLLLSASQIEVAVVNAQLWISNRLFLQHLLFDTFHAVHL